MINIRSTTLTFNFYRIWLFSFTGLIKSPMKHPFWKRYACERLLFFQSSKNVYIHIHTSSMPTRYTELVTDHWNNPKKKRDLQLRPSLWLFFLLRNTHSFVHKSTSSFPQVHAKNYVSNRSSSNQIISFFFAVININHGTIKNTKNYISSHMFFDFSIEFSTQF